MPSVITPCGGGGGSGIQFDTDPQDGDWLWIETTGTSPQHGRGIYLKTTSGTTGGIDINNSAAGTFVLENYGGEMQIFSDPSAITIFSADGLVIQGAGDSGVLIEADGGGDINLTHTATGGNITIKAEDGNVTLNAIGGFVRMLNLPAVNPGGFNRVWNDGGVLSIT